MTTAPTVLFVGAGRHQRRALRRVKELGVKVVAVDRNPDAPGLSEADVGEVVDFGNAAAVAEIVRNGRGKMPAIGEEWDDRQMDALTDYLQERFPGS